MNDEKEMTAEEMNRGLKAATQGFQYPANKMQDGLKALIATGKLDEEGADLVFWFYNYAQDNGLSLEGAGTLIGMSATSAYHVFHCDYAANYKSVLDNIRKAKRHVEEESKRKSIGFVKTWSAQRIFEACDAALYDHMPAFVYGASQSGKTTAFLEYQRTHNHGTTKYARLGSNCSLSDTAREIARACKCFARHDKTYELKFKIFGALNERSLLIIDEFHEALFTTGKQASLEVLEFIREIYDRTGCGIVMSATPMGRKEFETGANNVAFEQLRRRGIVTIALPDVPKVGDINKFARSFDLPVPDGETLAGIKAVLKQNGLGKFVKYLQKAYALATSEGRALTWDDFAAVNNGYAALAVAKNDY